MTTSTTNTSKAPSTSTSTRTSTSSTGTAEAPTSHYRHLSRWQERALLGVLSVVQFAHIVDFVLIMPLGPQLMRLFDITPVQFGVVVSSYSFTAAIFGFINAFFVDRLNRKTVLLTLFGLFGLATLACGLAPTYAMLLLARAAAGAFGGSLNAVVHSIVGDVFPPERRGTATGVVTSAFALASVIGVPIGIVVAAGGHWQYPFLGLAALCLPVWLLAYRAVPDISGHVTEDRSSPWRNVVEMLSVRSHQVSFLFGMVLVLAGFTVIPYISPYQVKNVGITERDLAYLYVVGGAATFFTSRWFGRLSDRYGKRRMFITIALMSIAPILITTHLPPLPLVWVIPFSTLFFVLVSGRFVPAMAMMTGSAVPRLRGSFLSVSASLQAVAMGIATIVGSAFLSTAADGKLVGYGNVGWFAVALTFVAIWLSKHLKAVS